MEIFGRVMALWALLLFVITMLIYMVPFLLFAYTQKDPLRTRRFILYSRAWMSVYMPAIGCPVRVRGREHFKKGETYVVICNHNSFMDITVCCPGIPGGNKTIAKIEFAKVPVFSVLYKTGSVLVDRKSEASRRESFGKMEAVLDMGLHMCIYPEGTRNKTDQPLKSFHDGAFRLSIMTGKAIIPGVIFNSGEVLPADKPFFLRPKKLEIHFLEAVKPSPEDTTQSLREKLFSIMSAYYTANQ